MPAFSPQRWQIVSPYLDRALDMTAEERRGWFVTLREKDVTLADDIALLLDEREALSREGFLEHLPAATVAPPSLEGQVLGAYTLVSPIGQGGMGSVWLAKRSDGRFAGQVAVKLLNPSLIGRTGGERFQREGQILARLRHPHIAHLIDAGVSGAGQPYLVLEHVDGQRIDAYSDAAKLDVPARLQLFRDVLDAVAHAHANLVVHRDIKPSNVLVTQDGRVKLLDFGIAKLLDPDAPSAEATALTREGDAVLTPEYAAPEQATGGAITTATDVHALGVLLYLLLAGRHPAGDTRKPPAELLKAILEREPIRVSDAATRKADAETLANAAKRATTPDRLRRTLQGDLDTIVAKALKKDPQERYASITALAEDLRRYLDHQPISARPDTLRYRAAKFVRRHRLPVAMAMLTTLALLAGLAGTLSQARRAEAERLRADQHAGAAAAQRDFALRQLSRAEAINDLNSFVLSDAAPRGKPFTARELLERAEHIVTRQEGDETNRVELLVAIGRQYDRLDEGDRARKVLSKAYASSRLLDDPAARAKAGCALANAIAFAGELDRAEELFQEAQRELPDQPEFALHRISCLLRGSEIAQERGDSPAAIARVLDARRTLKAARFAPAMLDYNVSTALAESYRMAGRNRDAADVFEAAHARLVALGRGDTETAGTLLNNWGLALHVLGRPLEAERLFRQSIAISSTDKAEHRVSPMLLNNLARSLRELHRLPEAADYAERACAAARRAGEESVVNQSLMQRASIYRMMGDLPRATETFAELEPRLKRMLPDGHIFFASLASQRALLEQARGDLDAAIVQADRSLALAEASSQGLDYLPSFLLRRSDIQLQAGRRDLAEADAGRALGLVRQAVEPGTRSFELGRAHLAVGRALQAAGKLEGASAAGAAALEHLGPTLGGDHPDTLAARRLVASANQHP
jgi:serine/threonine protein kinase